MKHADRLPEPRRLANVRYLDTPPPTPPYLAEQAPQVIYQYVEVPVPVAVPARRPRWPWYLAGAVVSPIPLAIAWVLIDEPGLVIAAALFALLIVCGLTETKRKLDNR